MRVLPISGRFASACLRRPALARSLAAHGASRFPGRAFPWLGFAAEEADGSPASRILPRP